MIKESIWLINNKSCVSGNLNKIFDEDLNDSSSFFPRREQGNCRVCYYATTITDIQLSGKMTKGLYIS